MDSRYYTVLREFANMEPVTMVVIGLALIVCAYMAWNIGANDVANAMGTSVGSRALPLKQAVIIAAIFEFAGAFFAGDAVTKTVRKGILTVDFSTVTPDISHDIAFGFIAAMMAAAVWLTIATRFGLPVSTTHSIIGGIIGNNVTKNVENGGAVGALLGGILGHNSSTATGGTQRVCNVQTRYNEEAVTVYSHSVVTFYHEGKQYKLRFQK